MLTSNYIDQKLQRFLVQCQAKPGRFYILPKLHKAGNPGRDQNIIPHSFHSIAQKPDLFSSAIVQCYEYCLHAVQQYYFAGDDASAFDELRKVLTVVSDLVKKSLKDGKLYFNRTHRTGR